MNDDHLAYKRATTVALIGLAIQIAATLGLFLYARFGQDAAALTGSAAMLLGVPVWLALALVLNQHRLERLESLEAEAYRTSAAAAASVFEEAGADQRVQAEKLAWMHRWFLPAVSVVVGALFVGLGLLRWTQTREMARVENFEAPSQTGWAIAVGLGIAVAQFIFARFVAGMAKQRVWFLLHTGSAAAVGSAIVGAAIGLAHFLDAAVGYAPLLRLLPLILAGLMVALGVEVFLNFVLNLYRPRRPGEYQRPALDSRVLAFAAAPDRLAESIGEALNYQFGFNVSSTWFYQLLRRSVLALLVLGALVMWLMSAASVVRPHERALLLANGRLVGELEPGLHLKRPWPMSTVEKYPASAVTVLNVGAAEPTEEGPILWTNEHGGDEQPFLVQPTRRAGTGVDNPGDYALLVAEVPVHYIIRDLSAYLALAQDGPREDPGEIRRELLQSVAEGVVVQRMAALSVDQLLGPERAGLAARLRDAVQARFDAIEAGVEVTFVGLSSVHPLQEVAESFEEVVAADQRRVALLEEARAEEIRLKAQAAGDVESADRIRAELETLDALRESGAGEEAIAAQEQRLIELILSAGGEAAQTLARARADRWARHLSARAAVASSTGQIAAYRAAPSYYMAREYFNALAQSARDQRLIIVPSGIDLRVDVNYEELEPTIGGFGETIDEGTD